MLQILGLSLQGQLVGRLRSHKARYGNVPTKLTVEIEYIRYVTLTVREPLEGSGSTRDT